MEANPNPQAWLDSLEKLLNEAVALDTIEPWLKRWDQVDREYNEHYINVYRDRHLDTEDADARVRCREFEAIFLPQLKAASAKLKQRFLQQIAGTPLDGLYPFQDLFKYHVKGLVGVDPKFEEKIQAIGSDLERTEDAIRAELDGRQLTATEVRDVLLRGQRSAREQVWRSTAIQRLARANATHDGYRKTLVFRHSIAQEAGFGTFREYAWRDSADYTADEARTFHNSVLQGIAPIAQRLAEHRRTALQLNVLRPWDREVGLPDVLATDNSLTGREVVNRLIVALRRVSPELATTLESFPDAAFEIGRRPRKANQGFHAFRPVSNYPFVFMTYRGNTDSLATLIHELGHALNAALLSTRAQHSFEYDQNDRAAFQEGVAFFFELFTLNLLSAPGCEIVSPEHIRAIKREKALRFVDRMQHLSFLELIDHRLYGETPGDNVSIESISAYHAKLETLSPDGIDFTDLEEFAPIRWVSFRSLRKPFSLGLYVRAAIGALAHYEAFLRDPVHALALYIDALHHSESLPDHVLYGVLEMPYPFETSTLSRGLDALNDLVS
jgi:oligoendopeptidase F